MNPLQRAAALAAVGVLALSACARSEVVPGPEPTASPSRPTSGVSMAPPAGIEVCWSARGRESGALTFSDLTDGLGVGAALLGMRVHAVAAGDVNDDGWVDLFVGSFADRPVADYAVRGADGPAPDRLLLGSADGFRVDDRFPGVQARTSGAAFADLDADGDLDLVLSRNPRDVDRGRAPSVVLRNDRGTFAEASVLSTERGERSIGVLDVDADGLLDLFVVEDRFSGGSSALYHNEGGLRFSDRTAQYGLPLDVHGLGVSVADLDADGRGDLFVAGSNRLFLQDDGRFHEEAGNDFAWEVYGDEDDVAGVAVGDLDGDGRPDLVLGQHYNSTHDFGREVPVRVYRNLGPGEGERVRFRDVTDEAGVTGLPTKSPHVEVVDFDADGRLDILTTAAAEEGSAPVVFRNDTSAPGILRFESVERPGSEQYWVTGATFDADHDGAVDVLLGEWEPLRPSLLLRADGSRGHWLALDVGSAGSAGIGAVVSVYEAGHLGDPERLIGMREITASTGYGAGAEPVARFGLGDAAVVDLEVRLPGRADPRRVRDVVTDRFVRVGGDCPA